MIRLLVAVLGAASLYVVPASGQIAEWQGTVTDNWFTAGNWNPSAVPGAGTNVIINTFSPNATTISGASTANLGSIQIGTTGSAELVVESGGILNNDEIGMLATEPDSVGFVIVQDSGSQWQIDHNLVIGQSGTAILQLSGGGVINNNNGRIGNLNGSSGGVTLNGLSSWVNQGNLFVGHSGSAALDIRGQSGVVNHAQAFVGYSVSGTGSVRVREGGGWSTWDHSFIGREGEGDLSIESGGMVLNIDGYVGSDQNGVGDVTVTGIDSLWTSTGNLTIGVEGYGEMAVSNGGVVNNWGIGVLGGLAGGEGLATIGADSQWISDEMLFIGDNGQGSLTIAGGEVINGQLAAIAAQGGSQGSVVLSSVGSHWHSMSDIFVGWRGEGVLQVSNGDVQVDGGVIVAVEPGSSGELDISGGTLTTGTGTQVRAGGLMRGWGTVNGPVTIADGGRLLPGAVATGEAFTLDELELQPAAELLIAFVLADGDPVHSALEVVGNLVLDGVLDVFDFGGAFGPGVYTIITFDGILTDNNMIIGDLPSLPDGHAAWIDTSISGEVRLVVAPTEDEVFQDRFEVL